MTILDETTRATLDAGNTVVLNGGYIVMSPETFKYALGRASIETLRIVSDGEAPKQDTAEEANDSFIDQGCKCHFCGKESDFTEYTLTISGGYASEHDLEQVTVDVCGECLEKMLAAVN